MEKLQKDPIISKIEQFFKVPEHIADKIQNVAERVKAGYVLIETRPRWNDPSVPWTRHPVAKMIFSKPAQIWKLYWMRASGKWLLYGKYKTLDGILRVIKEDKNGCFWG